MIKLTILTISQTSYTLTISQTNSKTATFW